MSKLSDRRTRRDRFHKKARKEGYLARAAYKLETIDAKVELFCPGQRVLDLGCSPGSWLQYAGRQVGPEGHLVGIDRGPIDLSLPNLRTLVGDVHDIEVDDLLGDLEHFDVVLSDMAPDTSGIKSLDQDRSEALFERALDIAEQTLAPGGRFAAKLFQGAGFQGLIAHCRERFGKVKIVKPPASRQASIEQYVTAIGYKGR